MPLTSSDSIRDLNLPVLLYVGRIRDFKKGLQIFLESIQHLVDLLDPLIFSVWIVGGSGTETSWLAQIIHQSAALTQLKEQGRLIIWGRVDNQALPELYSRAAVTVMPSLREQFGIVAIEAQSCACPVVASSVGGLQDLVIPLQTGLLVPPGNSSALALALSQFVRNKELTLDLGRKARDWTVEHFSRQSVFSSYLSLYGCLDQRVGGWADATSVMRRREEGEALTRFQEVFPDICADARFESLSTSSHHSVKIIHKQRTLYGKILQPKPVAAASRFNLAAQLSRVRSAASLYEAHCLHASNEATPRILRKDSVQSMMLMEWLPISPITTDPGRLTSQIKKGLTPFVNRGETKIDEETVSDYRESLTRFWSKPHENRFASFDLASGRLNGLLFSTNTLFFRTHPQVEIARLYRLVNLRPVTKAVPDLAHAIRSAYRTFCVELELLYAPPTLCHGDLKPSHLRIVNQKIIFLDVEETHFAVGPLDIGHWAYYAYFRESHRRYSGRMVIRDIASVLTESRDLYLGVAWLIAQAGFSGIGRAFCGDLGSATAVGDFINSLLLGL